MTDLAASDTATVLLDISDGLAEVTLNRPQVMNSLNDEMVGAFHETLATIETDQSVRAVLITGAGKAFSAGRDLADAKPLEEDAQSILSEVFNPLITRIRSLKVPTFAAVNGAALGVGFGIAMACDVVTASERARLGSPFANIGCVLDSGGHRAMVDRIGPHRTLDLIYTSRLVDGVEAASMGLVNYALPGETLVEAVRSTAKKVAGGPTATFIQSKLIVQSILDENASFDQTLAAEANAQGEVAGGPDYVEGITSFMEKRKPTFGGA